MKKILFLLLFVFIIGCTNTPTGKVVSEPISQEVQDFIDKASEISSFEFNTTLPNSNEEGRYYFRGRDIKIVLPKVRYTDNQPYDTIYLEKMYEKAFAYCSNVNCPEKDFTAEPLNYSNFIIKNPRERLLMLNKAKVIGEEKLDRHITKIVEFTDVYGKKGRMWVQPYYGVPLKIEIEEDNGKEEIVYKDPFWNTVRAYDVSIPSNVTLVGLEGIGSQFFRFILSEALGNYYVLGVGAEEYDKFVLNPENSTVKIMEY